jgi:uncharacterized LabA/DUF88 family protein
MYIDGAALTAELEQLSNRLGVDTLPFDYSRLVNRFSAGRAYYYDAWPERKANEGEQEFLIRSNKKQLLFSQLNRVPKLHVRTGTTRWRKKVGQQQKAVDVLLAVDVVTHALKGISEHAILVLSDLDFYPILDSLLHSPVSTLLVCRPQHVADDLLEVADTATALTKKLLLECCDPNFAARYNPTHLSESRPLTEDERSQAAFTEFRDQPLASWKNADGDYVVWHNGLFMKSPDRDIILENMGLDGFSKLQFSDGTTYPS